MLTVAIAGILMAVALPSYNNMIKNNCLTTSVNSLVSALQRARSEAVKRRSDVTIAALGGSWSNGWTETMDEDRDGDGTLDAGEDFDGDGTLDASVTILSSTVTCEATVTKSGANTITYEPDGFTDATATFTVCDNRTGESGKQLNISITGRPNLNSSFTCD
jgi:type IV fimbrial biogenesis protein FimT